MIQDKNGCRHTSMSIKRNCVMETYVNEADSGDRRVQLAEAPVVSFSLQFFLPLDPAGVSGAFSL